MLVVRPAGPSDLDLYMELAVLSGRGFTSLPEDEPTLRERLDLSKRSFEGAIAAPEAWYSLILEDLDTGEGIGVAGVKAGVGLKRPFFSFRVVTLAQSSPVSRSSRIRLYQASGAAIAPSKLSFESSSRSRSVGSSSGRLVKPRPERTANSM